MVTKAGTFRSLVVLFAAAVAGTAYLSGAQAPATKPAVKPAAANAAPPAPDLQGVVNKYCVTCHSERMKLGGLVLEKKDVSRIGEEADMWERVAK